MTTPDKERCTERVQLVLTPSDAAALRRLARETGVSMAGWVRVAVRNAAREAAARALVDALAAARGDAGA